MLQYVVVCILFPVFLCLMVSLIKSLRNKSIVKIHNSCSPTHFLILACLFNVWLDVNHSMNDLVTLITAHLMQLFETTEEEHNGSRSKYVYRTQMVDLIHRFYFN